MNGDHYLYVIATIRDGSLCSPVKVGITSNWRSRLKQVQTGSAHEVDFAWVFNAPDRDIARELEQAFHRVMAKHRMKGEWFDLNPARAVLCMCRNIQAALEANLPDWTEEDRATAYSLTTAPKAEAFINRMFATHTGTAH